MKFKKVPKNEECECTDFGDGLTDEDFASFCKTPEAMKRIVAGCISEVGSEPMYVDGAGQHWTKKDWKARFGYDPKPAWDRMKKLNIVTVGGRHR
jgi:hypothetical protein